MQMHKYVMNVTYLFQLIYRLKTTRGREWLPHFNFYVTCVVDYSLANNQIAKALIVLSVFIPVCL